MPDQLPVACTLTPEALAARQEDLLPGLARRASRSELLEDGLRLTFAADALTAVAAVVDAERRCCRFLRFDLSVEPEGGPVTLSLTGPAGTREFLAGLLDGR
jgi:hypothetical protein